jgi:hypothetical protein
MAGRNLILMQYFSRLAMTDRTFKPFLDKNILGFIEQDSSRDVYVHYLAFRTTLYNPGENSSCGYHRGIPNLYFLDVYLNLQFTSPIF